MIRYEELTSEEASAELARRTLFLPIGATEQHGPHLPLSVDSDIAKAIAEDVARRVDGIVAPVVAYAARSLPQSGGGHAFPGTIHVHGATLVRYFEDILSTFARWGATNIVIINGHYENEPFLFEAVDAQRERQRLNSTRVVALSWWSVVEVSFMERNLGDRFFGWHAEHAGIAETSLMMYLRPDLVRDIRVDNPRPPAAGIYRHPAPAEALRHRGVLSHTSGSSAEFGRDLMAHVCDRIEAALSRGQE